MPFITEWEIHDKLYKCCNTHRAHSRLKKTKHVPSPLPSQTQRLGLCSNKPLLCSVMILHYQARKSHCEIIRQKCTMCSCSEDWWCLQSVPRCWSLHVFQRGPWTEYRHPPASSVFCDMPATSGFCDHSLEYAKKSYSQNNCLNICLLSQKIQTKNSGST